MRAHVVDNLSVIELCIEFVDGREARCKGVYVPSTCSTCAPHPAQLGLLHLLHVTRRHIIWRCVVCYLILRMALDLFALPSGPVASACVTRPVQRAVQVTAPQLQVAPPSCRHLATRQTDSSVAPFPWVVQNLTMQYICFWTTLGTIVLTKYKTGKSLTVHVLHGRNETYQPYEKKYVQCKERQM